MAGDNNSKFQYGKEIAIKQLSNSKAPPGSTPLFDTLGKMKNEKRVKATTLRGGKSINQLQEFSPKLRKKLKGFLKKIPKNDRKYKQGSIFFTEDVYSNIVWDLLKEKSSELSDMKNMPIFLLIPNFEGIMIPIAQEDTEKVSVNLLARTTDGKNLFLDDSLASRYVSFLGKASMENYKYFVNVGGEIGVLFTGQKVPLLNSPYKFTGLKVPMYTMIKTVRGKVNVVENVYICTDLKKVKEDYASVSPSLKNIKNIHDLTLVWDFDNDRNIYSEEETYIILSNLLYMEEGNCALDLILCGKPSAKKTSWLDLLKEIFDEKEIMSVNATNKSLVPSFYFDSPKPGVLCDSKYVTLLDDYFRMFSQRSDKTGYYVAIKQGLESVMNLLDRKDKTIPSGKRDFSVRYNASFFATDNFAYHEALTKVYDDDPAILRRYTFLLLEHESEEKGTSVCERDINEVIALIKKRLKIVFAENCFLKYRLLFTYLRNIVPKIEFDINRFKEIINQHKRHDIYLQGKAKALMKSVIALNTILRWNKETFPKANNFKATEEDYLMFDRLLNRIVSDFLQATKRIALIGDDNSKIKDTEI